MKKRYAFFPGCVLEQAAAECRQATEAVLARLGVELVEIPGWSCCGASHVQDIDDKGALAANARNLALAEAIGLPVLTVCSTCTLMLRKAKQELDGGAKDEVNRYLATGGLEYKGTVEVTHLLWELAGDVDAWAAGVTRPLSGLKVAPFYGCHTIRPPKVQTFENALAPTSIERIIAALGAEAAPTPERLKCCGFHAVYPAAGDVLKMTARAAEGALAAKADCLVTPCPLCQMQLDMYQPDAGVAGEMPCLHLAQLVGLGLGLPAAALGLSRHVVAAGLGGRFAG